MSLQSKIETKLSEALKAQDKKTYSTLRLIIAAIKHTIIAKKIKQVGASSIKDMGKVIGALKKEHADVMDFSKVSQIIKENLK